jgi:hypothetical protein
MAVKQGEADWMELPVAFVFDTQTGFAWIEPHYLDPLGTSRSALHEVEATLEARGNHFAGVTPSGHRLELGPADPDEQPEIARALAAFDRLLAKAGRTKDEERALVRQRLLDSGIKLAPA